MSSFSIFIVFEFVCTQHPRCLQTALLALSFLSSCNSSRADEFRTACDAKFELSTVFKTPSELAPLREQVLLGSPSEVILEETAQS